MFLSQTEQSILPKYTNHNLGGETYKYASHLLGGKKTNSKSRPSRKSHYKNKKNKTHRKKRFHNKTMKNYK